MFLLTFYAPHIVDRLGDIVLVLSVCHSVCWSVVNFNLCYNFWTVRDTSRDFIFGMHAPLIMPFQITSRSMILWPLLKKNSFFGLCYQQGHSISQTHLVDTVIKHLPMYEMTLIVRHLCWNKFLVDAHIVSSVEDCQQVKYAFWHLFVGREVPHQSEVQDRQGIQTHRVMTSQTNSVTYRASS